MTGAKRVGIASGFVKTGNGGGGHEEGGDQGNEEGEIREAHPDEVPEADRCAGEWIETAGVRNSSTPFLKSKKRRKGKYPGLFTDRAALEKVVPKTGPKAVGH